MATIVADFDPSANASGQFTNSLPGAVGTLVVYNDSGITIDAMWNGESKVLPAGMIDIITICNPANIISWQQDYILSNVASWPASIVKIVGYRPDEQLPYSAFPVPLQRTSNVGNTIPVSTSASAIQNDNNPPGTSIAESMPSDQASSSVALNNDASGFLKVLSANVLRTILDVVRGNASSGKASIQIGDSGDTSILTLFGQLNTLIADSGLLSSDGNAKLAFLKAVGASNRAYLDLNPGDQDEWQIGIRTDGALFVFDATSGFTPLVFKGDGISLGRGGNFSGIKSYSGTSSGTVTHALGATPVFVGITQNVSNSTDTVGVDSIGSSTFHLNINGAFAWVAFAYTQA